MRLIAYARVSTEDQQTIDAQVAKVRCYCELHDHELVDVFTDHGVSGKTMERAGLKDALRVLDSGGADGLAITKLDRLSRSVADWCELMKRFERKKKTLVSVLDSFDTSTAAGRLVVHMFASIAEFERDNASERTRRALQHLRSQGRRISRHAPYGLKPDPDNPANWILCSREQGTLIRIRELSGGGLNNAAIARKITDEGHRTRKNTDWSRSQVWRILRRSHESHK
jgi:site-specific DNA recombinase